MPWKDFNSINVKIVRRIIRVSSIAKLWPWGRHHGALNTHTYGPAHYVCIYIVALYLITLAALKISLQHLWHAVIFFHQLNI